jgi:hypothetical protein
LRTRWVIRFGALFLADLIGIGCAILLFGRGSDGIVATGLALSGSLYGRGMGSRHRAYRYDVQRAANTSRTCDVRRRSTPPASLPALGETRRWQRGRSEHLL